MDVRHTIYIEKYILIEIMGKYLKLFENHTSYDTFINGGGVELPNVSHCINEGDVHYNPIPETRLVTTFYVSDASQPTRMYGYYIDDNPSWSILGVNLFDMINIDGVDIEPSTIDSTNGNYQLSQGNHVVIYTLNDDTKILGQSFWGCPAMTSAIIPNSVEEIEWEAFRNCTAITSVTLNDGLSLIGDSAFEDCDSLINITIPNSVSGIDNNAFGGCDGLASLTILSETAYISSAAFSNCTSLSNVTIPNSVTISSNAFRNCTSLQVENNGRYINSLLVDVADKTISSFTIKDGTLIIGDAAFYNCQNLASVSIPNGLLEIGNSAFSTCPNLSGVTLPNTLEKIGVNGFGNCTKLTNIVFPNSVNRITTSAFYGCTNLETITFGSGVTAIDQLAFGGCSKLSSIISLSATAPAIQFNTFRDIKTNGTLYVPQDSTGYDVWMGTGNYYLGKYDWTKVEQ